MERVLDRLTPNIDYESTIARNAPFTDTVFPPIDQSLVHPLQSAEFPNFVGYEWKRAKEIFHGSSFCLINRDSSPTIRQGTLGDCYFLCSLAAISHRPSIVADLLLTPTVNEAGCYAVSGYIMGQKHTIVIDDHFPFDPVRKAVAFAKPFENQIWVPLLEKAWAKVNGSFGNIESGVGVEGLQFLTGAPCQDLVHDSVEDKEQIWTSIMEAYDNNYIMTCSAAGVHTNEEYQEVGLVKNHSYTLLEAKEVVYKGRRVRLVKLQNPWGYRTWTGNELTAESDLLVKDDGSFYMPFEEYLKYYESTAICMWRRGYTHSTAQINDKPAACHTFRVEKETEGFIEICFCPKRLVRNDAPEYQQPTVFFIVGKIEGDAIKYVACAGRSGALMGNTEIRLSPGLYVVFTMAHYPSDIAKMCTIHGYTSQPIHFVEHEWDQEGFAEVCKDYARTKNAKWADTKDLVVHTQTEFTSGFGFIYVLNNAPNIRYNFELEVKRVEGMAMVYPVKGGNEVTGVCEPGGELISVFQIVNSDTIGIATSYVKEGVETDCKEEAKVVPINSVNKAL